MSEMEALVTALCLESRYGTLYRLFKDIPGSLKILTSDSTAEQKRRELLKILKEKEIK